MRTARQIALEYLGEGPNAEALAASIDALVAYHVECATGQLAADFTREQLNIDLPDAPKRDWPTWDSHSYGPGHWPSDP